MGSLKPLYPRLTNEKSVKSQFNLLFFWGWLCLQRLGWQDAPKPSGPSRRIWFRKLIVTPRVCTQCHSPALQSCYTTGCVRAAPGAAVSRASITAHTAQTHRGEKHPTLGTPLTAKREKYFSTFTYYANVVSVSNVALSSCKCYPPFIGIQMPFFLSYCARSHRWAKDAWEADSTFCAQL